MKNLEVLRKMDWLETCYQLGCALAHDYGYTRGVVNLDSTSALASWMKMMVFTADCERWRVVCMGCGATASGVPEELQLSGWRVFPPGGGRDAVIQCPQCSGLKTKRKVLRDTDSHA